MSHRAALTTLLFASMAEAGPKSLAIAVGDCREPELTSGATAFSDAVGTLLRADALDPGQVVDRFKPRPNAGVDDVQRQLDAAQSQFYDGQLDKALETVRAAMASLIRLPPSDAVSKKMITARVLEGLIFKGLSKKDEQVNSWRQVLRIAPDYKLDPDFHSPASIAQFDAIKKEMAKVKKVPLTVTSTPAGASVFLDGTLVGKTPLKNTSVLPGAYRVIVTQGEAQSFAHDIKLEQKPVELAIDLGSEGTLRPQLPLCVAGADFDAVKLASRVGADQALLLRVESRGAEPAWVSAVLYDVTKGTRIREGGMKVAAAKKDRGYSDLASFVLTGQPAALALPAGEGPVASAKPPPSAGSPSTGPVAPKPSERPAGGAAEPVAEPAAPSEVSAAASSSSAGGGLPRFVPLAIAGAGVVLVATGVGYWFSGSGKRSALASITDASGQVTDFSEVMNAVRLSGEIRDNRNVSLALGIGGGVLAVTGAVLFFVLAPKDSAQPMVMITPEGAFAGVSGRF